MSIKSFTARLLAATSLASLLGGWTFFRVSPDYPIPQLKINIPIALHQAGSMATTELLIPPDNSYPCSFDLRFSFHEKDRAERERLSSFVGRFENPGTTVPVRLTIIKTDGEKESPCHEQLYKTTGIVGVAASSFTRRIDTLSLESGKYRIKLEGLNDFPELAQTPVSFIVRYSRPTK